MSAETTTYLDVKMLPYPFCPGCGHAAILDALDVALTRLNLDRREIVLVTDIGCHGLSDQFFATNAFHGLHGRSITYATGIKLVNPELKVIVLIGDGGCGIGGAHLLNAARRNIGLTVLVFNNFNFGMTGGEHSATTPVGGRTATTQAGNIERPMDICATVAVNGASLAARTTTFDKALPDLIAAAIQNDGFSLVDIWELCTAYYAPANKFSRKVLEGTLATLGFATGVVHRDPHPEYSRAYRESVAPLNGQAALPARPLQARHRSGLSARTACVIAGAAGKRIGAAAGYFSRGALLAGLWATQRDDYPVTVRTGFSLAEVILSPEETLFTGIVKPDLMVVLFAEGLQKVAAQIKRLTADDVLYIHSGLLPVETGAQVIPLDFSGTGIKPERWALAAMAEVLRHSGLYPLEAYREAAALRAEYAAENFAAIDAAIGRLIRA
ncbi:MAG: thiamine pyrophosphate-dependent enzyme [Chloroflexota bacterium]